MQEFRFGLPNSGLRDLDYSREIAALHESTRLAIESAFRYGTDMPVGAVALLGEDIVGRGFASDKRLGNPSLHAEVMAVSDANLKDEWPDAVVSTLEPCDNCQDFLATQPGIRTVAFGLPREAAISRDLVKSHPETIFQRAERVGLPYEIIQLEDEQLALAGMTLLDHISRDPDTGLVNVDTDSLSAALSELNKG